MDEKFIEFYTIANSILINLNQPKEQILNELKSKLKFNINCFQFLYEGNIIDLNTIDFYNIKPMIFYRFIPIII
jgi:hypothetical protein